MVEEDSQGGAIDLQRPRRDRGQQVDASRVGGSPPLATRLAVSSLCVVPDVGSWSAPSVMAALARVVHNRQGAADPEHNRRENNQ